MEIGLENLYVDTGAQRVKGKSTQTNVREEESTSMIMLCPISDFEGILKY